MSEPAAAAGRLERVGASADGAASSAAGHPGPAAVALPATIRDAMIAHARAEYPNEMCGIVIGDAPAAAGGRALRWEPARNEARSPYRYRLHPDDLLRLTLATWDEETVFWAVVHSHVRSPAVPSPTDIGAATYPGALYVLVSLSEVEADPATGEPSVRAWRIVDGSSHEVAVRVES